LMRAVELSAILDCAELAAHASLYRTESRWGLYHYRTDHPERNDRDWSVFVEVKKGADGRPHCFTRPIPPYLYPIDASERDAYGHLRVDAPETV
ncbi:MAG: fumarate reductase/succinate dehydrogenase flavoprotein subunit, partial [Pollutimonas bauzanensis]